MSIKSLGSKTDMNRTDASQHNNDTSKPSTSIMPKKTDVHADGIMFVHSKESNRPYRKILAQWEHSVPGDCRIKIAKRGYFVRLDDGRLKEVFKHQSNECAKCVLIDQTNAEAEQEDVDMEEVGAG